MKKILVVCLLAVASIGYGQKKFVPKLGKAILSELEMTRYQKDSTATALVLEEKAHTYLSESDNLDFRTDFYHRIKLFDKQSFYKATISIELFDKQKADDIEAYSYHLENGKIIKTKLDKEEIYSKDINVKWREVVFTIPNLKEGSVIEYKYSVVSPYYTIDNWYFQSEIPKLNSEYQFTYLGNYKYNVRLIGFQKLNRTDTNVIKDCVNVPGLGRGSCGVLTYGMDSIPAFKEEQYMLSKENFISHLKFDLISFTNPNGSVKKFTKIWKDADKSFKKIYLDGQVNKKKYFEKNLPSELLTVEDPLSRATGIYKHIQNRFTWNERYWSSEKIRVKNAYDDKTGGVDEINLSLYNSLQAAKIESYLVMVATRSKAIPTKLFPVTKDFNYVIVKAVIDGESYFLDATDKFLNFGQIPVRCLNGEGRVLDFEKGSYWQPLRSDLKNYMKIFVQLKFDENNELNGTLNVIHKGYEASSARETYMRQGEEEYISSLEKSFLDFEIDEFSVKNLYNMDKPFTERFTIVPDEADNDADLLKVNPFLYFRITENPFKLEERKFPVDFGFKKSYTYTLTIKTPKGYKLKSIPEKMAIAMPNNTALFVFMTNQNGDEITLNYRYQIKKRVYSSAEYFYLKEFYNQIIKLHNSFIEFEKI